MQKKILSLYQNNTSLQNLMEVAYSCKRRREKFEAVVNDVPTINALTQSHTDPLHSEYSPTYLLRTLQMLQQLLDHHTPAVTKNSDSKHGTHN